MKHKRLPDNLWELVDQIGWGTKTTNYDKVAKWLFGNFLPEDVERFKVFIRNRVRDLYQAVKTYEDEVRTLELGSDDGMSDLIHHVVGLGEKEFNRCLESPIALEERKAQPYGSPDGYKESFAYCFLEPIPARTTTDKKDTLRNLLTLTRKAATRYARMERDMSLLRDEMQRLETLAKLVRQDMQK